jgi:hypothetical protein
VRSDRLPGLFCLRVKVFYLLLKLMEALNLTAREEPEKRVVSMVNRKTLKSGFKSRPGDILLLLPHCLQFHGCPHRITFTVDNCRECGKCPVGDLSALSRELGVAVGIATGGTLARRLLRERKPKIVVAVACPRDLGQGILDALPVPVLGVANLRPHGDCFDTGVSLEEIRGMIARVVSDQ